MNEQDEKILEQYLKDLKKQRIIISLILFLIVIIGFIFSKEYMKRNGDSLNINNEVIEVKEQENSELVEMNTTKYENEIIQENVIDNTIGDVIQEEPIEKIEINESKETVNIGETIPNDSTSITSQTETSNIYEKPSSKYFLFTEGYTMEDVSEAAQNYLKSSGYAGECVPLQDSEGVYIGMKVIFY